MGSRKNDSDTPKEDAYDEHISPLMREVIALAKRHKIPMYASFALDGDQFCTTAVMPPVAAFTDEEERELYRQWRDPHERALQAILVPGSSSDFRITTRDASGNIQIREGIHVAD